MLKMTLIIYLSFNILANIISVYTFFRINYNTVPHLQTHVGEEVMITRMTQAETKYMLNISHQL